MEKNVVYSTEISKEIRNSYANYIARLNKIPQDKTKTNAAYCLFAQTCEKENKIPLKVAKELKNELLKKLLMSK